MRSDILDMHVVQRKSMVKYFQQLSSRVAITTDIWTANHQKKSYMAVSAHYIDEKWELKSFLLRWLFCFHHYLFTLKLAIVFDIIVFIIVGSFMSQPHILQKLLLMSCMRFLLIAILRGRFQ